MYIKYLKQKQDIKYLSDNIFSNKIDKKINSQNVHIGMYSNAFSEIESSEAAISLLSAQIITLSGWTST